MNFSTILIQVPRKLKKIMNKMQTLTNLKKAEGREKIENTNKILKINKCNLQLKIKILLF